MNSNGERAAIAHMAESETSVAALRDHLREIVEGEAFRGSHRSAQFLTYIVDHALAGHFDSLKERMIGIELFGRSPSYDTSQDAIVRVTASDVRKRLLQHYGKYGSASEFRITLPLGTYIPDIAYEPRAKPASSCRRKTAYRCPGPRFPAPCGIRIPHQPQCPPCMQRPRIPPFPIENSIAPRGATRKWMVFAVFVAR